MFKIFKSINLRTVPPILPFLCVFVLVTSSPLLDSFDCSYLIVSVYPCDVFQILVRPAFLVSKFIFNVQIFVMIMNVPFLPLTACGLKLIIDCYNSFWIRPNKTHAEHRYLSCLFCMLHKPFNIQGLGVVKMFSSLLQISASDDET